MVYILGTDFFYEVAKGKVVGHKAIIVSGHNDDIDSADEEDLWEGGGHLTLLSGAQTMNIKSSNVADDDGVSGANTVLIQGLDNDYNEISETITMNGTTDVLTTNAYRRVRSLTVRTVGEDLGGDHEDLSGKSNVGNITATSSVSAKLQCQIDIDNGVSNNIHYTVPAGNTSYILKVDLNSQKTTGGQSPIVHFLGHVRPLSGAEIVVFDEHLDTAVQNFRVVEQPIMPKLAARTDIRIDGDTDQNDTIASAKFYIIQVDDSLD